MKKILYSNYDLFDAYTVEQAKLYLAEYLPDDEIDDDQIERVIYNNDEDHFNDIMSELDAVSSKHFEEFCAIGTAQTWQGCRQAMTNNCYDSISDCIFAIAKDCNYIELWLARGNLHIKATHHDGTHHMIIKGINLDKERAAKAHVNFGMRFYDWLTEYSKRPSNYLVGIGREVAEQFGY